jgi:hypothetical protein
VSRDRHAGRSTLWGFALAAGFLVSSAGAQILHGVTANCELYTLFSVPCSPVAEIHRVSPSTFTTYADSCGFDRSECRTIAFSWAGQYVSTLQDSVYVHETSSVDVIGPVDAGGSMESRSDAVIHFVVDPGQRLYFHVWGTIWTANPNGGTGIGWYQLARIGPGVGRVLDSKRAEVRGAPTEALAAVQAHGILEAGDYMYQAHLSTIASQHGLVETELWLRFKLYDVTAIVPTTWGAAKLLFR